MQLRQLIINAFFARRVRAVRWGKGEASEGIGRWGGCSPYSVAYSGQLTKYVFMYVSMKK